MGPFGFIGVYVNHVFVLMLHVILHDCMQGRRRHFKSEGDISGRYVRARSAREKIWGIPPTFAPRRGGHIPST